MEKRLCGLFTPQEMARRFSTVEEVEGHARQIVSHRYVTEHHREYWNDVVHCFHNEPCEFEWEACI
jgi:hypothetical protein